MTGKLILEDKTIIEGISFGATTSIAGEVVFSTGMTGYPETMTDPSFAGQILIFTYPIIGNYGIPDKKYWESEKIQTTGIIVSQYIDTPSHSELKQTLAKWLKSENIPALEIPDTRHLTKILREKGTMLGKIIVDDPEQSRKVDFDFYDPNLENLVARVSTKKIIHEGEGEKTIVLIDCGAKENINRCLINRGVKVITVPWNADLFTDKRIGKFDAIVISNGPGDPKMAKETIATVRKAIEKKIPILGVCLGNQILALAAGGDTYKLKFGHRSQNQPCTLVGTKRCYITTQNHGFAVSDKLPKDFNTWFVNANDGSNEGIIHTSLPIMSVQFHPEATPGPVDTEWIFDYFLEKFS